MKKPPEIKISGGGGTGAVAQAILNEEGSLTAVELTDPGIGYINPPSISLSPSNGAVVIATLDDSVINNARNIPGTNRWVLEWAPQVPGTYNISAQAIDEDMGSSVINTTRWLVITPKSSSLPPLVSLNSPSDGGIYTEGSNLEFMHKPRTRWLHGMGPFLCKWRTRGRTNKCF